MTTDNESGQIGEMIDTAFSVAGKWRRPPIDVLWDGAKDVRYACIATGVTPDDADACGLSLRLSELSGFGGPLEDGSNPVKSVTSIEPIDNQSMVRLTRGLPWRHAAGGRKFLYRVSTATIERSAVVAWNRGRWTWPDQVRCGIQFAGTGHERLLKLAPGLVLANRYQWHVKILGGFSHVRIPTDPAGVLDFFRNRDAFPGERRRALLHWVKAHSRRARRDGDPNEVRAHLRGARSFSWNGYQVAIEESSYDRDRLLSGRGRD